MSLTDTLTPRQKDFLNSYFKSIFDEDAAFADADEDEFLRELSQTEFSDVESVHGRLANIAKALEKKGVLREVISDPANPGCYLTVRFNETTARTIYALVQEAKNNGTFYDLACLPVPAAGLTR